ncbi:hypothetical protein KIN20_015811 [Parelaphostrongylus tenuis]|uniref:Uncharacterized protein n=1 Tax=Parelaphostrongylus tenuis TaxID=148309 RepID=A0AAD5MFJ2_PARTN|nr:hypothetical protein KIN20_015811 [Parelaphostrongylus tenuis]
MEVLLLPARVARRSTRRQITGQVKECWFGANMAKSYPHTSKARRLGDNVTQSKN